MITLIVGVAIIVHSACYRRLHASELIDVMKEPGAARGLRPGRVRDIHRRRPLAFTMLEASVRREGQHHHELSDPTGVRAAGPNE